MKSESVRKSLWQTRNTVTLAGRYFRGSLPPPQPIDRFLMMALTMKKLSAPGLDIKLY